MPFVKRLVLRTWLPPILWAIGTPLEPLVTGRKRAEPISDGDVDPAVLEGLDAHVGAAASALARWLVVGAVLALAVLLAVALQYWVLGKPLAKLAIFLGASVDQYFNVREFNALVLTVTAALAYIGWAGWLIVIMAREMSGPLSALDNRLILALKLRAIPPDVLLMIHALPPDSAYRLYVAPLIGKAPPPTDACA